ncbi:FecR domain-containing protein [Stutzerimonas kirkiae]|uniref:FecR domain-containing protein n=1 Tax=Stutzerimonas kirkiae TaxID=2211392 RepID=UPI001F60B0C4|nr:FecR domain-containing protein [Stutzerimonas kirkiae]
MNEQERLIEEASHWIVRLQSGQASDEERQAFQQWRMADTRHERLCRQLENTLGVLRLPVVRKGGSEVVRQTLAAPSSRRRFLQQTLVGAGLLIGTGLLGSRVLPVAELSADLRTGTGERRKVALDDGTQLTLNARSAVDIHFGERRRELYLHSGEILASIADDRQRPFVIRTRFGQATAQGRELLIRLRDENSLAIALRTPALIETPGGSLALASGQQVAFDQHGVGAAIPATGAESAWIDGLLEVRDRPLREVVDALRPYRSGIIRLDPGIAGLHVSGLFRLDDSDLALDTLARTHNLRLSRHTDLWVTLSAG